MCSRREVEPGKWTLLAEDYLPIFRKLGVTCVIRFNKRCYDRRRLTEGGIKHVDLFYEDGGNPSEEILQRFLKICENTKARNCKRVALHDHKNHFVPSSHFCRPPPLLLLHRPTKPGSHRRGWVGGWVGHPLLRCLPLMFLSRAGFNTPRPRQYNRLDTTPKAHVGKRSRRAKYLGGQLFC